MNDITRETGQDTQALRGQRGNGSTRVLTPPVDVIEDGEGITLYADMPGVARDKLNLQIEADTLTIEGEMGMDIPKDMAATHAEVATASYRRTFTLSKELDAEHVSAQLKHGVLTLRIPKAPHAQPRRIAINVA